MSIDGHTGHFYHIVDMGQGSHLTIVTRIGIFWKVHEGQYSDIMFRHLELRVTPKRGWTGMLFPTFALSIWQKVHHQRRGRNLSRIFPISTRLSSKNDWRRTEKSQRK